MITPHPDLRASMPTTATEFHLQRAWQRADQRLAMDAVALWLAHGVLTVEEAWRRSAELVVVARQSRVDGNDTDNRSGAVIGVSTAFATWCPPLDLPMYFLRVFVAPRYRNPRVARELLAESVRTLAPSAPPVAADAPRGVWLEIQNPKIDRSIRDLVWRVRDVEFVYIGCSDSGVVSRAHYFPGTRLPRPDRRR